MPLALPADSSASSGNQQDPIRFRNLVKALEESLRQKYSTRDVRPLLEPLQNLAEDHSFWNHTLDGLALLTAPGVFRVYRLQRPVAELAVVANSFHIKPLIRILQSADRYHVLGLSRQEIKLLEGNRDTLDEVELFPAVPLYSNRSGGRGLKGSSPVGLVSFPGDRSAPWPWIESGTGGQGDRTILPGCRSCDPRALLALEWSALVVSGAAATSQFLPPNQPQPIPDARRSGHPSRCAIDRGVARPSLARHRAYYLARLAGLVEMFGVARSKELGADDLAQIAASAVAGRVGTLLIEADRHIPGRIDVGTGRIEFDDLADPEVDDVLDDVGELVLKNRGQIVIVPAERMPTQTGIAAIYRF